MAFLGRLFGGGGNNSSAATTRAAPPPPRESAGEQLSKTIDTLERREKVLEKRIADEGAKAKEFLAKKNQKMAATCVKKRRLLEDQLTKLSAQKMNLEILDMQRQDTAVAQEVIKANQCVAAELKRNQTNVEDVENIRETLQEALEDQKEVGDLLAEPLGGDIDDDELAADMAALQQEVEDDQFLAVPSKLDVNVPTGPIAGGATPARAAAKEQDEDDTYLKELEAELAGA
ncbi:Vacuolar protein sorting-associated protein 32-like protein 1 [Diplonema papillatum]|nr:Vacuolar protein sorting-associated protein 32-like protein 1 [Diplonema papillatum]